MPTAPVALDSPMAIGHTQRKDLRIGGRVDFKRTNRWPKSPMRPAEIMGLIAAFQPAIGIHRLAAAQMAYRHRASELGGLRSVRIQERQPLIEAFALYDTKTFGGRRKLKAVPGDLALLANVANLAHVVLPTLPDVNRRHHLSALLNPDGQFRPTLLEWKTAAQLGRLNRAELAWMNPGAAGPEFVARRQGVEWEVECKHLTDMVTQVVGEREADDLGESIVQAVVAKHLQGSLTVHLPPTVPRNWTPDLAQALQAMLPRLTAGPVTVDLGQGLVLSGNLALADGKRVDHTVWVNDLLIRKTESSRMYGRANKQGNDAVDPVDLNMELPEKPLDVLREDLWEKKFKKAALQCSGNRGALLSFEWHGFDDARLFQSHPIFQGLIAQTFNEFRHIAAIGLRCGTPPSRVDGHVDFFSFRLFGKKRRNRVS